MIWTADEIVQLSAAADRGEPVPTVALRWGLLTTVLRGADDGELSARLEGRRGRVRQSGGRQPGKSVRVSAPTDGKSPDEGDGGSDRDAQAVAEAPPPGVAASLLDQGLLA